MAHLGFHGRRKLGAIRLQNRDVVLYRHGVIGLAAKALGRHTSANAFAGGVHRCRCACGATANDQHVVGVLGRHLGRVFGGGTGVQLGHNFFDQHAAVAEQRAIQVDAGHGHDFAVGHFHLECTAFDDGGFDLGVKDGHEAQGLHHVRAVVAAQAHIDLEIEVTALCRA